MSEKAAAAAAAAATAAANQQRQQRQQQQPTQPQPQSGPSFLSDAGSSLTPLHPQHQRQTSHDEGEDGLPGYSEMALPASTPTAPTAPDIYRQIMTSTPGIPAVDISSYIPSVTATLSRDETTVTLQDLKLSTDPEALVQFVRAQAALPPRPTVRITGYNSDRGSDRRPDFDIRINLMHYLVRPRENPWNYVKLVEADEMAFRGESGKTITPHPAGGLQEWARLFCKSKSPNKS